MLKKEIEAFCPTSRQDWRLWLEDNHQSKDSVWLVYHKKKSGKPSISWSEAVDEALCFGWIDSIKKTIDEHTYIQFFSKRKPNSVWSKINKDKIDRLLAAGLIKQAGHKSVETAKENGSWSALDSAEEFVIPDDLELEFLKMPASRESFLALSKSVSKGFLQLLLLAKRPETRQKRIAAIVEAVNKKQSGSGKVV